MCQLYQKISGNPNTLLLLNLYLRILGRSIPQSQSKTNHSPLRFQRQIFMPSSRQNHQSPVQQRPRFTRTRECGLVTSFALLPILLPLFPLNATLRFTDTNFSTRRLMGMSGRRDIMILTWPREQSRASESQFPQQEGSWAWLFPSSRQAC